MQQGPQGPFEGQQPPQQWQGQYPQQQPQFPSGQYPPQGQQYPQGYPNQQYGQQPPFVQPPAPAPKKKRGKGLLIGSIVVVVALLICIIASVTSHGGGSSANATTNVSTNATVGSTAQSQPTAKPTVVPKWTTTQKFSGNGSKNTPTFTVSNNWKIVWTCNPASFDGGTYNLIITPTGTDGTPTDAGVNTMCKAGNTSDSTTIQPGGTIALDVISEGDWTIQVQELK